MASTTLIIQNPTPINAARAGQSSLVRKARYCCHPLVKPNPTLLVPPCHSLIPCVDTYFNRPAATCTSPEAHLMHHVTDFTICAAMAFTWVTFVLITHDQVTLMSHAPSHIYTHDGVTLMSHAASHIYTYDGVTLMSHAPSHIYTHDGVTLMSHAPSHIYTHDGVTLMSHAPSHIYTHDGVTLMSHAPSHIYTHDGVTLISHGASHIYTHDQVTLMSHAPPLTHHVECLYVKAARLHSQGVDQHVAHSRAQRAAVALDL